MISPEISPEIIDQIVDSLTKIPPVSTELIADLYEVYFDET